MFAVQFQGLRVAERVSGLWTDAYFVDASGEELSSPLPVAELGGGGVEAGWREQSLLLVRDDLPTCTSPGRVGEDAGGEGDEYE